VKKAVDKVLVDWKTTGRRMVIEEFDGSDSEDKEADLNMKNTQKSATSVINDIADKSSSMREATVTNVAKLDDKTSSKSETGITLNTNSDDKTFAVAVADGDRNRKKLEFEETMTNAGDVTVEETVAKDAVKQSSNSDLASGDAGTEPLPPAVQALKDDGNDLFRKGQYGEALDKYTAAIQILTGDHSVLFIVVAIIFYHPQHLGVFGAVK